MISVSPDEARQITQAGRLAAFVVRASYEDLSETARRQLKIRILDSLGCAIGALEGEPIKSLRAQIEDFGGNAHSTLIGGGRTSPDQAAFYNGALVRYLDFNDSYLAKGETCHPSDNLGAILAAAEYARRGGRTLMTALAVAYQVQCRLSDVAPVRARGFDHTTQGSFAVAICGTASGALRVTRTGALSHWKGLAYPNTAFGCVYATFLAMRGVTGPPEVFEGNKGFMDAISGRLEIDWSREDLERVTRTIVKKYNAEIHSQSAIEAVLELKEEHGFIAAEVARVEIETFDVAYHIIGGGVEGDKKVVRTKEEADHSLPYIVAVAILDDQVMPEQYQAERIERSDVQSLLRKIHARPSADFSRRFPDEMPCRVTVELNDGRILTKEKRDYEGFLSRPMSWEAVARKFERLSAPYADRELLRVIIDAVANLEAIHVTDLTRLLGEVQNRSNKRIRS